MKIEIKISPVQPFITSSQKIQDFWSSSYIISLLSYKGMLAFFNYINANPTQSYHMNTYNSVSDLSKQYSSTSSTLGFSHSIVFNSNNANNTYYQLCSSIIDEMKNTWINIVDEIIIHCKTNNLIPQNINNNLIQDAYDYFKFIIIIDDNMPDKETTQIIRNPNFSIDTPCSLFPQFPYINYNGSPNNTPLSIIGLVKRYFMSYLKSNNKNSFFLNICPNTSNIQGLNEELEFAGAKKSNDNSKYNDQELTEKNNDVTDYAFITMDGDKIGDFIKKINTQNKKSQFYHELNNTFFYFNQQVAQIIKNINTYNPKSVAALYCGGDDVVIFCKVKYATEVTNKIILAFNQSFDILKNNLQNKEYNINGVSFPTISSVIYIGKYDMPVKKVLQQSSHILDNVSKNYLGRNSTTIVLNQNGSISYAFLKNSKPDNEDSFNIDLSSFINSKNKTVKTLTPNEESRLSILLRENLAKYTTPQPLLLKEHIEEVNFYKVFTTSEDTNVSDLNNVLAQILFGQLPKTTDFEINNIINFLELCIYEVKKNKFYNIGALKIKEYLMRLE